MGGSFFVGNGEGIEVLAKPIFVRGVAPSMEAALPPLQWPAYLVPGWRALRLASALSSVVRLRGNSKYVQNCMILRFVENIFELRAKFKSLFQRV